MFQAVYTAGKVITEPVTTTPYRHRLIAYEKLVAVNFTHLHPVESMAEMVKRHRLPRNPRLPGFRAMAPADVPEVTVKLNQYLSKFKIAQVFNEQEVAHWFLPRPGIVGSYVVQTKKAGIQAFISFYVVPSAVPGVPEYDSYTAAYIFYYFARPAQLTDVARAAMEVAHWEFGADVINCLDVLDNREFKDILRFVDGDGSLNYYFYNYATAPVDPSEMAIVLL
jgi:glycylpeptide N-tetradecanoyltransferase